jgi:hypothetical protein
LVNPEAPSATIKSGAPGAAGDQIACERQPVLVGLAHAEHHRQQHALPFFAEPPVGRVEKQRHEVNVVEVAAFERLIALAQLLAHPRGGRLRQLPQPRLLAQRLDVAHPLTNAPTTNAFKGSVRTNLVPLGNSLEANVSAASRT